jgi:hypothetical protein
MTAAKTIVEELGLIADEEKMTKKDLVRWACLGRYGRNRL